MNAIYLLFGALIGYLFGAIPFGWIFVKLTRGLDLRQVKSGRTGGTNAMRAAGPVVGGLTAIGDVLKGAAAIWIARALFAPLLPGPWLPWAEVVVGLFAIVGHNWSVFLAWGGGAGTGPNVGWASAIWWPMAPIAAVVVVGVILLTGIASVASLSMGVLIPVTFAILYFTGVLSSPAYIAGGILSALIVTWALRPNIRRLVRGEERVVGPAARRRKLETQRTKS
jgi:glycerol-3-phosphate acyltransferase PlsY